MGTSYPNSIDNFTNPTANDHLNSVTVPHHQQHADANDAIESIETILGTNPEGIYANVKSRLTAGEERISDVEDILDTRGTMFTQNANSVNITGGSIINLSTFDGIIINGGTF